jgi:hypothetical protein
MSFGEQRFQRETVRYPGRVGCKPGVVDPGGLAQGGAQLAELAVRPHRQHQLAPVGGAVHGAVRHNTRVARAQRLRVVPGHEVCRGLVGQGR